jgi:hypothetical protein
MKLSYTLRCYFILLFISLSFISKAQLLINEVAPTNKDFLADEDGDFEDWIELYNAGTSSINLNQYNLSDGKTPKWPCPNLGKQLSLIPISINI